MASFLSATLDYELYYENDLDYSVCKESSSTLIRLLSMGLSIVAIGFTLLRIYYKTHW